MCLFDIKPLHYYVPPKGVLNFVQYKFSHLAPKERQTMFELSKMFLLCLNYWKLETPTQYRQRTQKDDGTAYKVDYTRCVNGTLYEQHNNNNNVNVCKTVLIYYSSNNVISS